MGLIDVYPHFHSAEEAKDFLRRAADGDPRFHAHAAQFEVEAWLLPYWDDICRQVGVRQAPPGRHPEEGDDMHPPSHHLGALYRLARPHRKYVKTIEMPAILRDRDLTLAARQCPELQALLNTLLTLGGLSPLL